jgi:hypothetical protein
MANVGSAAHWEDNPKVDQLRLCMNVLRLVARQHADANRQLLLQRQIDGYLVREAADPKASLERLADAIDGEAEQGGDWSPVRDYVQSCLDKLPSATEG